ncbi:MAG: ergothioneine biosynthesis protein EgtC [Angustibacter sp.]
MCRHLGWLGAPRSVHDLVLAPEHGLLRQSYAPRRQQHGLVNADGWGVGFWRAGGGWSRWRSTRPIWQDASLASVAPALWSSCVLAAVRSATVGMPIEQTATAPFAHHGWLVSHNGLVDRGVLPRRGDAESVCDAALLAAHAVAALVADGPPGLARVVARVGADDPAARLNLMLADGSTLLATTWGDTLTRLSTGSGTLLASEPCDDDPDWVDIPDRQLVQVTGETVTVTPLEELA